MGKKIIRCITSIQNNTYRNFEVIIVDDGSTDNTVEIVRQIVANDLRFKLVLQNHAGPSAARNRGIMEAKGDIVSFIDSDDYIEEDYFEILQKYIEEEDRDVIFFGYRRVTKNGDVIEQKYLPKFSGSYYNDIINLSKEDVFGYTWCKAYKCSIIKSIKFKENLNLFEDEVFTCEVMSIPRKIGYVNHMLYNYVREDEIGLSRQTYPDYYVMCEAAYLAWKRVLKAIDSCHNFLESKANHFVLTCKWYGLEQNVNTLSFYKGLAECQFLRESNVNEKLIALIKQKKWLRVWNWIMIYKWKNRIYEIRKQ